MNNTGQNIRQYAFSSLLFVIILLLASGLVFGSNFLPFDIVSHFVTWSIFWFLGTMYYYKYTLNLNISSFLKLTILISLIIRILSIFWYYFIYNYYNGVPFEAIDSDQMFYHETGIFLSEYINSGNLYPVEYFKGDYADFGYPYFIALVYSFFGQNIIILRIIQAVLSTISVFLLFKISRAFFNDDISKLSAILMLFSPLLIRYCGTHLKETLFVFLILAGTYGSVKALDRPRINYLWVIFSLLTYYSLFAFRTMTGLIFIFSFLLYYLYTRKQNNLFLKYAYLPVIIFGFYYLIFYSPAFEEVSSAYDVGTGYSEKVLTVSTSAVLKNISVLPVNMVLVLLGPFPVLLGNLPIDADRLFFQQIISPETLFKCMLLFVFIIGVIATIKSGIRKNIFLLSIIFSNLFLLSYTGVMLNLRHFLPVFPFLFIMSAAGLYNFKGKLRSYYIYYLMFLLIIIMVFNYFKLSDYNMI